VAHIRTSRPDYGFAFKVNVLQTKLFPFRPEADCMSRPVTRRLLKRSLISHNVFSESFCRSQFPHKSVNLFLVSVMVKDKVTPASRARAVSRSKYDELVPHTPRTRQLQNSVAVNPSEAELAGGGMNTACGADALNHNPSPVNVHP